MANGGGSNTGEVLRAASQIIPGSFESFYSEFKFLADQIHNQGAKAEASGFQTSARDAYFRSAEYYRAADFFLHGNASDPRLFALWDAQLADFAKAISLLPVPGEKVTVQGPNFTIPIYFYPANKPTASCSGARIPTVIVGTGYDGNQEALYHSYCRGVLDRGWNCVTYEGPGQATPRRYQNIGFIPDWWNVITPIVDYLSTRADVDMARLALSGESFGAVLSSRAFIHDKRIAALLLIDGLDSLLDSLLQEFPAIMSKPFLARNATLFNEVTEVIFVKGLATTSLRWGLEQGMWSFMAATPYDWLDQMRDYNLNGILNNVTRPVFIGSGQNDTTIPGQAEIVHKELGSKGYYYLFQTDLGAGEHCQIGAEAQLAMATLNWLAGVFGAEANMNSTC